MLVGLYGKTNKSYLSTYAALRLLNIDSDRLEDGRLNPAFKKMTKTLINERASRRALGAVEELFQTLAIWLLVGKTDPSRK